MVAEKLQKMSNYELNEKKRILLKSLNRRFLFENKCFFGGGSALNLIMEPYRHTSDIDFICSDIQGYRNLRRAINSSAVGHGDLGEISHLSPSRDVRANQYSIRTAINIDGGLIPFKIVIEARLDVDGFFNTELGVPVLETQYLIIEKLLANTDRGYDSSTSNRDIIDLAMMMRNFCIIDEEMWATAEQACPGTRKCFLDACERISDINLLKKNLVALGMDINLAYDIKELLNKEARIMNSPNSLIP